MGHAEAAPADRRVRPACSADRAALDELERRSWDATNTPAPPARRFELPIEDTLVAVEAGVVAGYVTLGRRTSLPSNAHVARIRALAVASVFRGRGLGALLLAAAEAQAIGRGNRKLCLSVLATNAAARRLYERAGFEVEGVLAGEFLVGGALVDDLLLAKRLA